MATILLVGDVIFMKTIQKYYILSQSEHEIIREAAKIRKGVKLFGQLKRNRMFTLIEAVLAKWEF